MANILLNNGWEQKPHLLIISDYPQLTDELIDLFGDEMVCSVANGLSGLLIQQQAQAEEGCSFGLCPDLIILFGDLVSESSLAILEQLKAESQYETLPFIIVTKSFDEEFEAAFLTAGAMDVQSMPICRSSLKVRVRNQLKIKFNRDRLESLSHTDPLTQIANRRRFETVLDQEWKQSIREQSDLSLLMIDVDFFKQFNDLYGHPAGDECLQQVAACLSQTVGRPKDLVSRFGGEEFAVLLPNTSLTGANLIAERICKQIARLGIPHKGSTVSNTVTVSAGVATISNNSALNQSDLPRQLVAMADQGLYAAKQCGRNTYSSFVPSHQTVSSFANQYTA